MERVLIVNADDFGLSKGQNYGIIEGLSQRRGVTSTTALVNGAAIDHAAQLGHAVLRSWRSVCTLY
ncbi:ChbG/HpnK family deacetylase [Klebsiella pneumoniae subsp. pneumoniae]|nr:ChbG/HpnK family deacetylase [Klebsiella pneumoniae subsp. pneumoniae]